MADLRAVRHDIITPADGPFEFIFRVQSRSGETVTPVDMTGTTGGLYDAAGNPGTQFSVTVGDGAGTNDQVTFSLTANQVAAAALALSFTRWQMANSSGVPLVTGTFRFAYPGDGTAAQTSDSATLTLGTGVVLFELSGSFGGGGVSTLGGLTDVTLTAPSTGQVIKYDGFGWVNGSGAASGKLSWQSIGGDDVSLESAAHAPARDGVLVSVTTLVNGLAPSADVVWDVRVSGVSRAAVTHVAGAGVAQLHEVSVPFGSLDLVTVQARSNDGTHWLITAEVT